MSRNGLENRVRWHRFHAGEMTQAELAERVGVTRQTILALEANRYVPSLLLAMRIARVFAVPVEAVFSVADSTGPSGT